MVFYLFIYFYLKFWSYDSTAHCMIIFITTLITLMQLIGWLCWLNRVWLYLFMSFFYNDFILEYLNNKKKEKRQNPKSNWVDLPWCLVFDSPRTPHAFTFSLNIINSLTLSLFFLNSWKLHFHFLSPLKPLLNLHSLSSTQLFLPNFSQLNILSLCLLKCIATNHLNFDTHYYLLSTNHLITSYTLPNIIPFSLYGLHHLLQQTWSLQRNPLPQRQMGVRDSWAT